MDISRLKTLDYIFIVAFCVLVVYISGAISGIAKGAIIGGKNGFALNDYVLALPILGINFALRLALFRVRSVRVVFAVLLLANTIVAALSLYDGVYFGFERISAAYKIYFTFSYFLAGIPLVIFAGFLFAISKVEFKILKGD